VTPGARRAPHPERGRHAAAALAYAALALWVARPVLRAPATAVLFPTAATRSNVATLVESDQRFVSGTIARNARSILASPASVLGFGSCYPLWQSFALGEHLFGESLLGVAPWLVVRDPIAVTNAVTLLTTWLAAVAMYALVFGFTRSSGAGFVAGLVFAFHPGRLDNPAHPMVHGNLWAPLALLFADRLFATGRWGPAFGLAGALALALLESFYQILGLTILGGVFGVALAWRERASLVRLLPKLAVVAAVALAVAALVLRPYLRMRSAWGVLQGRDLVLMWSASDYLPGGSAGMGWVPCALAGVGILDRLRGPRGRRDPRWPLLAGGFLVFWCSVYAIHVPLVGRIESPPRLLSEVVPGLDAVRVLRALRFNVYLVAAVLAGYGALALAEAAERPSGPGRARELARAGLALALAALVATEIFVRPLAAAGYGEPVGLTSRALAAPPALVDLYARIPAGAVLDLPFRFDLRGRLRSMAAYVLLAGYHGQPVAACYNSFSTPLQRDVEALAGRLPDPAAADELHALGFRTVVVHEDLLEPAERVDVERLLSDPTRAALVGRTDAAVVVALASATPVTSDPASLAPGPASGPPASGAAAVAALAGRRGSLSFAFANPTSATYRHPDPIEPSPLVVRWRDAAGRVAHEERVRALLPIALSAGAHTERSIEVTSPPTAGSYEVELASADAPERVLSRLTAHVPAQETANDAP